VIRIGALFVLLLIVPAHAQPVPGPGGFDPHLVTDVYATALAFMAPRTLEPTTVSQLTIWGLRGLTALDPSLTTVPYLSTGATDSARLRAWGMQAFGLLPFPLNQDDEERMHGNDERIPLASLEFGTKLIYGAVARVAR